MTQLKKNWIQKNFDNYRKKKLCIITLFLMPWGYNIAIEIYK